MMGWEPSEGQGHLDTEITYEKQTHTVLRTGADSGRAITRICVIPDMQTILTKRGEQIAIVAKKYH